MNKRICIDIGHGGGDSGAVSPRGMLEKKVNFNVAVKLRDMLVEDGYRVTMTRTGDTNPSFTERCRIANSSGASLFISIHHNRSESNRAKGYDVIYEVDKPETKRYAEIIGEEFGNIGQEKHRIFCKPSTKYKGRDWFGILQSKVPTLITEFCFLDASEMDEINTLNEQWAEAGALYMGIRRIIEG